VGLVLEDPWQLEGMEGPPKMLEDRGARQLPLHEAAREAEEA
jgi:hypothetical protein